MKEENKVRGKNREDQQTKIKEKTKEGRREIRTE